MTDITRRSATFGGLGLAAALAASPALALDGPLADLVHGFRRVLDGRRRLHLRLSARDHGDDPAGDHQRAPRSRARAARWASSSSCASIPTRPSATSPPPMPTRSTRRRSSTSARSPGCSPSPTWASATSCSRCSTAGPTSSRCPGKRTTGDEGADLCDHRSRLVGHAAGGRHRVQVADGDRLASRPHLLHRHARGLRGRPQAPGRLQAAAAVSTWGKDYTPPAGKVDPSIDMKTAVRDQVNSMSAVEYFTLLCELMKANPPAAADAPALEKFAAIGIVPGPDFDKSKFDPAFEKRVPEIAFGRIMLHFKFSDGDVTGHQWLGLHHQDRHLRHELHPAGAGHGYRPRRQPAAGRHLSDLAEGRRGCSPAATTAPTTMS